MSQPSLTDGDLDEVTVREFHRFYQFVREVILPYEPMNFVDHAAFHHQLMYTACKPLSATAAPRGFLKSVLFSKYRALHRIVDPAPGSFPGDHVEFLLLSETSQLIKDHMAWHQWHLLNNRALIDRYGMLADPSQLTWNEDAIELTNRSKLFGKGYGSQLRGLHPTDIIVDDLESRHNAGTDEALENMKDDFWRVIWPMRQPETNLAVIGTIIRKDSLLSDLIAAPEFHGRLWRALEGDGTKESPYTSIWPERWPVELLLKQKRMMGTHKFNAEYQNQPVGLSDLIILPEWIRRHKPEDMATMRPIRRYIACDPAFTEERWGDYSAIIVADEMSDGRLFERVAWRKKVEGPELVKTLMDFYYHFSREGCEVKFGIEEVAAQKMLRQSIIEKDPSIQVVSLKPAGKDKVTRLIDVSRYFEMGVVSLSTQSFVDEVMTFPVGVKDRVDAFVYVLKMYEQEHPVIADNSSIEVDSLKTMEDTALGLYMDRVAGGHPFNDAPSKYVGLYDDAAELSALIDAGPDDW